MRVILFTISIVVLMFLPVKSQAQHYILSDFFVYQKDNNIVKLQWTFEAGETCNGINIERAGKNKNFEKIGLIRGICGAPDREVTYRFTDSIPLNNQISYYRLELGSQGFSSPVSFETRFYKDNSYVIKGSSGFSTPTVLFNNTNNTRYTFRIFDTHGNLIRELTTNSNRLQLPVNKLSSGMYIFVAFSDEGSKFSGKFPVL